MLHARILPLLGGLSLLSGCGAEPAGEHRPDVVLFVIDTLRADRLKCYGYERESSPNIDRLAAAGTLFEDVTAQGSFTRLSMTSLMTGRYMTSYRTEYEPDVPTLAEVFGDAGYRTIGITANKLLSARDGFDRGFHHYDDCSDIRVPTIDVLAGKIEAVLDRALAVEGGAGRPPIFLYVQVMEPHAPCAGREEYFETLPLLESRALAPPGWHEETFGATGTSTSNGDPGRERSWTAIREGRGQYDHEVRYTDQQLGALLERFEQLGMLENGVVALAADHGEGLWDHVESRLTARDQPPHKFFRPGHGSQLYSELVRTPLVLWGPKVPRGVRVSAAVENVDLFPTLVELAGLEAPGTLHGSSLVPLMRGAHPDWRKDVHAASIDNVSLRDGASGMKLILPTPRGEHRGAKPGLYNLQTDPHERDNLFDARPDEVARLRVRIEAWRECYPVETTAGRKQKRETIESLRALGYADHIEEDGGGGVGED